MSIDKLKRKRNKILLVLPSAGHSDDDVSQHRRYRGPGLRDAQDLQLDHEGLGLGHLLTYDGRGRSDIIIILAWYGHHEP